MNSIQVIVCGLAVGAIIVRCGLEKSISSRINAAEVLASVQTAGRVQKGQGNIGRRTAATTALFFSSISDIWLTIFALISRSIGNRCTSVLGILFTYSCRPLPRATGDYALWHTWKLWARSTLAMACRGYRISSTST